MKRLQILLAEDNRGDVMLVREALKTHDIDYELHVVPDGDRALHFVATMGTSEGGPCPDVLLLDLNLPKVDGTEVLKEFRKHPACVATPVIVVSSSDAARDRKKMEALHIAHYFKKPSDFDAYMKLGDVIRQVVTDAR